MGDTVLVPIESPSPLKPVDRDSGHEPPPKTYSFEDGESRSRRHVRESDLAYRTLLARLGVDDGALAAADRDGSVRDALKQYCTEYPLNIAWYDNAVEVEKRKRLWVLVAILAIGFFAAAIMIALAFTSSRIKGGEGLLAAQIGALFTGVLGVLQVVSSMTDSRTRFAIFWKARSDLKERLYSFEGRWHGKATGTDGALDKSFATELLDEIAQARKIGRSEQEAFFNTYKNPGEVLAAAQSALDVAKARLADALALRKDAEARAETERAKRAQSQSDAQKAYAEAVARRAAAGAKLEAITRMDPQNVAAIAAARGPVIDADAEVARTASLLDAAYLN
jgi:hypothetical protein